MEPILIIKFINVLYYYNTINIDKNTSNKKGAKQ